MFGVEASSHMEFSTFAENNIQNRTGPVSHCLLFFILSQAIYFSQIEEQQFYIVVQWVLLVDKFILPF